MESIFVCSGSSWVPTHFTFGCKCSRRLTHVDKARGAVGMHENGVTMAKVHHTWSGALTGYNSTPMETDRVWIDGCFGAMHFGKANWFLEAKGCNFTGFPGHARLLLTSRSIGTTAVVEGHSNREVQAIKSPDYAFTGTVLVNLIIWAVVTRLTYCH